MNHRNSLFKRAAAFLLSLLMTVTSVNLGSLTGLTGSETVTAYADTTEPTGQDIVKAAMKYLGYGYSQGSRYGANGTFDCSGLVKKVLQDVGMTGSLPDNTGEWLTKAQNHSLSLKDKDGKTIKVYYAKSYAEYKQMLADHKDEKCAVVIDNVNSSTADLETQNLAPGTIIVTQKEGSNAAHAQIVIGKYGTYPVSNDPTGVEFWNKYVDYMDSFTGYLKSEYGLTSTQLSQMKVMPADMNNAKVKAQNAKSGSYRFVQDDVNGGYLNAGKFTTRQSQNVLMAIGTGASPSGSSMPSKVWAIDAASVDFGVRIKLGLSGKHGASHCVVVTYNNVEDTAYHGEVKLQKQHSLTHDGIKGVKFTLATGKSGSALSGTKVTAITGDAGKLTFTDSQLWTLLGGKWTKNAGKAQNQTFYLQEDAASARAAGFQPDSTIYTVTVRGDRNNASASAVKITRPDGTKVTTSSSYAVIPNVPLHFTIEPFKKVDASTGQALSGAEFTLYARRDYAEYADRMTSTWYRSGTSPYCWEPIGKSKYNADTNRYEFNEVTPRNTENYRVVETKTPAGYTGGYSYEFKMLPTGTSYSGSLPRFNYGDTVKLGADAPNTPEPATIQLFKYDDVSGTGLTGAEFTVYERTAKSADGKLPSGWKESPSWYWKPVKKMTDMGEGIYEASIQSDQANMGYFRVYETKAPAGYTASAAWYWEVREAKKAGDPDNYISEAGVHYIAPGKTAVYGEHDPEVKGVPNTPQPATIRLKKIDGMTGEDLTDAEFSVYERVRKDSAEAAKKNGSWKNLDDTYYLRPYGSANRMTYDSTEKMYVFRIQSSKVNDGYFCVYETKAPAGYTLDEDWYWEVRECPGMEYKTSAGVYHVAPGGTSTYGQFDEDVDAVINESDPTGIRIEKVWYDNNNNDRIRPDAVTISLTAATADGKNVPLSKLRADNPEAVIPDSVTLDAANRWQVSLEGLPSGCSLGKVTYGIIEKDVPAGYTVSYRQNPAGTVLKAINTHAPETTEVRVEKVWRDQNNAEKKRPGSIVARLYADGTEVAKVRLRDTNEWKHVFTTDIDGNDLLKYRNGNEIVYEVAEDPVSGYESLVQGADGGYRFTLINTREATVEIPVRKEWDDYSNAAGKRSDSITAVLYADGRAIDRAVLNAANGWQHVFTDDPQRSGGKLPKYTADGTLIRYEVTEEETPDGYTAKITQDEDGTFVIRNIYREYVELSAEKIWDDQKDAAKERPQELTVTLYAAGKAVNSAVLNAENGWKCSFTAEESGRKLPKYYANGALIAYEIREEEIPGYTGTVKKTVEGNRTTFTLTNTYREYVEISAEKEWDDYSNAAGKRPTEIIFILHDASGREINRAAVTENENWSHKFTTDAAGNRLPMYTDAGEETVYTVTEICSSRDYVQGTPEKNGNSYLFTNTYREYVKVSAEKIWDDYNDAAGKRPAELLLHLRADGGIIGTAILTEAGNWKTEFLTDDNGNRLDRYDAEGNEIEYTITEKSVPDYSMKKAREEVILEDGTKHVKYILTNRYSEYVEFSAEKIWTDYSNAAGKRPAELTVTLYADGTEVNAAVLKEKNEWKADFTKDAAGTKLPRYAADGHEIAYEIREADVPEYTGTVRKEVEGNKTTFTFTNTYREYVEFSAEKVWNDQKNAAGKRPAELTVTLYAAGKAVNSAVLNAENGWKCSFTAEESGRKLPKYYADGALIRYEIREADVPGYTGTVEKKTEGNKTTFTFTNSMVTYTGIPAEKIWDDYSNAAGKRPERVTFVLHGADGQELNRALVSEAELWKHMFTTDARGRQLPKYNADGEEIAYTVTEICDGTEYVQGAPVKDGEVFTFTNTYREYVEISAEKIWTDYSNAAGKRPAELTVTLYADGQEVNSAALTAENGWKAAFAADTAGNSLEKYTADGQLIAYEIREADVPEYAGTVRKEVEGNKTTFTFTNTYREYVEFSAEKVWNDQKNAAGKRPAELTVTLYAAGKAVNSAVLNAENGWKCSFTAEESGRKLPKYYASGALIAYEIREEEIPGYTGTVKKTVEGNKTTFTFTNSMVTYTGIPAEKIWDDYSNAAGKRPERVTFVLHGADGQELNRALVSEAELWKHMFTTDARGRQLPKYTADGEEIAYTVTEICDGTEYVQGAPVKDGEVFTFTNTYREYVEFSAEKVWDDYSNAAGKRPAELTVILYADGQEVNSAALTAENGWKAAFAADTAGNSLEKYTADGQLIAYEIREADVPEYTGTVRKEVEGNKTTFTFTNTYREYVEFSAEKVWDDYSNAAGKRPAELTVILYADGQEVNSAGLTAENGWKAAFAADTAGNSLEKYTADGQLITYEIREKMPEGYTGTVEKTVEGNRTVFRFTNVYREYVEVSAEKIWDDYGNAAGTRPAELPVTLYADGTEVNAAVLNEANGWKADFTADAAGSLLEKYTEDGKTIEYTITEDEVPGYTGTVEKAVEGNKTTFAFTNTYREYVEVSAEKIWKDYRNAAGTRPAELPVTLYADGTEVNAAVLNEANGWKADFTADQDGNALPKYTEDGKTIEYSIIEGEVLGYAGSVVKSVEGNKTKFNFTNTYEEYVELSAEKIWDDYSNGAGLRPETLTVHLLADGEEVNSAALNEENGWKADFTADQDGNALPKYTEDGKTIEYTITEDEVLGYTGTVEKAVEGNKTTFTFTNTYEEYVKVSAEKIWDDYSNGAGLRPVSLTVYLLADGEEAGSAVLSEENSWKADFTETDTGRLLARYAADGHEINYTVTEEEITGYTGERIRNVETDADGMKHVTFTLTNTYREYVEVSAEKIWDDYSNGAGLRPVSLTVYLLADGEEAGSAVLSEENSWKADFTETDTGRLLARYAADGHEINYTVTEEEITGYTGERIRNVETDADGMKHVTFTFTNTHEEYVELSAEKIWDDYNDGAQKRPVSLTVHLLADGAEVNSAVLNEETGWKAAFTADQDGNALPKYTEDGKTIEYTITEDEVSGYTGTVEKTVEGNKTSYTFTNIYREYVQIPAQKTWNDDSDRDGIRPDSITVFLYKKVVRADGSEESVQLNRAAVTEADGWATVFTTDAAGNALDKYTAAGEEIFYGVGEDVPAGYTSVIDGNVIINTHEPEVTRVGVNKFWNDQDGTARPDSITVHLYADGNEINTVQLTAEIGWTYTFTADAAGRPLYIYHDGGQRYVYTVSEDVPEGWLAEQDGNDITNTPTWLTVSKQDITTGAEVAGAQLSIYQADENGAAIGEALYSWTSTEEQHVIYAIPAGSYVLREELAPETDGYVKASDIPFTILPTGTVQGVIMQDDYTKTEISKTDITTGAEIAGAHLQVTDAAGNIVAEWTTDGTAHRIDYLALGTYVLTETAAPEGYVIAESVEFTVAATGEIQKVEMKDDYTKVEITKTDITTGEEVIGAQLSIYRADEEGNAAGEALYSWTTTTEVHRIDRMPAGSYVLREELAPEADGYVKATDILFTILATGEIQKVEMKDDYTKVEISKTDITTGEELIGAHLQITDADGNIAAEWITDGSAHRIDYLAPGTYVLTETAAPEGYVIAESVEFTVAATGEIQKVEMKDDYTKVEISKTDITTGEELIGAHLQITDIYGSVIAEWITDGTPYHIDRIPAGVYTLTETAAPEGYVIAESVEFTVAATGEIQKVEMQDDYTKVEISKTDITTGEEVIGAQLSIYRADEEGKATGEALYSWTTTTEVHRIDRMPAGSYVLREELAPEADGYVKATDILFTILATGEIQKVEMKDDYTKVEISKTDITTGEELIGAHLQITDADGNIAAEWITDGSAHRINYLAPGTYVLTETAAPEGYVIAESVEFTVAATGEIQRVEMQDDYTKVEISKTDMTTGEEVIGAHLSIYRADEEGNATGEALYRWTTTTEVHRIDRMPAGSYVLREELAPEADGYVKATEILFVIEATGEIQRVEMKDDYTKLEISKTDITTGKELIGAHLQITDADGNIVAEWTTDGEPHRIDYLAPGTYVLTEITAPEGYEIAESITFTVNATGEIQKVEMKDQPTPPPILGIEESSGPIAMILLFLSMALAGAGVWTYRKKEEE